jgi:hypothetical protein
LILPALKFVDWNCQEKGIFVAVHGFAL